MVAAAATPVPKRAVLLGGAGPKIVSMEAQARNARVVQRAGFELVPRASLGQLRPDEPVLAVPNSVTLARSLPASLPTPDQLYRLPAEGKGKPVLWGPAGLVTAELAGAPATTPATIWETPGGVLGIADAPSRRAAETVLLRSTQKPTDGIVSRNLNRYISRFFSRRFLRLGMKADQASYISLSIGLACAVLCAMTGWWTMALAGVLFQLASAFDGVDGEMARVTLGESPRGAWLDTAVDNATYLACLIGIVVGWSREGLDGFGIGVAIAVVVGIPVTIGTLMRFVNRYGPDGSLVFVDRTVERAAKDTGLLSLKVARICFYALRRDIFSFLFMLVALTGSRSAPPAACAVGLGIALLTFAWHRKRLVEAAKALREDAGAPVSPSDSAADSRTTPALESGARPAPTRAS